MRGEARPLRRLSYRPISSARSRRIYIAGARERPRRWLDAEEVATFLGRYRAEERIFFTLRSPWNFETFFGAGVIIGGI